MFVIIAAATFWVVGSGLRVFVIVTGAVFSGRWICSRRGLVRGLVLAAGGWLPVIVLSVAGNAFTAAVSPASFA